MPYIYQIKTQLVKMQNLSPSPSPPLPICLLPSLHTPCHLFLRKCHIRLVSLLSLTLITF